MSVVSTATGPGAAGQELVQLGEDRCIKARDVVGAGVCDYRVANVSMRMRKVKVESRVVFYLT